MEFCQSEKVGTLRKDSGKLSNLKKRKKKRVHLFGVNVVRHIIGDKDNVECTCREGKYKDLT